MPFLSAALAVGGIASSLGGGAIAAHGAQQAAKTQAQAAEDAATLQQQDANAALQEQNQQSNLAQQNSAPYRRAGQNAVISLNDLLGLKPFNPYPINAGGNIAPQAGGLNSPAVAGQIVNPAAPSGVAQNPNPLIPRAKGGRATVGLHYLVGEKGPEELVMHGDGTGTILPHPVHPDLIPRAWGGGVGHIPDTNIPPGQIDAWADKQPGDPGDPRASTGGRPANPPAPSGTVNSSGNPLVTGGNAPGSTSQLNPFQSWVMPFQAPTMQQAQNEPGYQFQVQQGEQALANQASANGELGDSNYGRALVNYGQQAAQSDYQNVYNRARDQYQQQYNIFQNNQGNQFNRLAALAGIGQTSTGQLNQAGQQGASNSGNILLGSGGQIGQNINNAGAATASGYVGGANAYGGALGNIGNNLSQYLTLQQILGQQGGVDLSGINMGAGSGPYVQAPG
jgi:hypothetical protein